MSVLDSVLADLTAESEQFCQSQPARLTAAEREQIRQRAQDVPALWQAYSILATCISVAVGLGFLGLFVWVLLLAQELRDLIGRRAART